MPPANYFDRHDSLEKNFNKLEACLFGIKFLSFLKKCILTIQQTLLIKHY